MSRARSRRHCLAVTLLTLAASACRTGPSDRDAEEVVRRYNRLVTDAYRAGDYRIAVPVVSDAEAHKLAGHIGARLDQNLTLDARLLELVVHEVARSGEEVVVSTTEQWHYADRRVGSGEQVGQDSRDSYAMRYYLRQRADRAWIVDHIEFASKPTVGRTEVPDRADPLTMHGVETRAPSSTGAAPARATASPSPRERVPGGGR
jgi:hypothetical protein